MSYIAVLLPTVMYNVIVYNCIQQWFGCNVCLSLYYSPKQMLFGILPSESWETPSIISCVDALYPHPTTVSIIRIIIKIKLNKIKKHIGILIRS